MEKKIGGIIYRIRMKKLKIEKKSRLPSPHSRRRRSPLARLDRCSSSSPRAVAASGASVTSPTICRGEHQFSIFCYGDLLKRARPGEYIASATFRCAGYDWAIFYYPAGDSIPEKEQERVSMATTTRGKDLASTLPPGARIVGGTP
jgi:hypothetical protein